MKKVLGTLRQWFGNGNLKATINLAVFSSIVGLSVIGWNFTIEHYLIKGALADPNKIIFTPISSYNLANRITAMEAVYGDASKMCDMALDRTITVESRQQNVEKKLDEIISILLNGKINGKH